MWVRMLMSLPSQKLAGLHRLAALLVIDLHIHASALENPGLLLGDLRTGAQLIPRPWPFPFLRSPLSEFRYPPV